MRCYSPVGKGPVKYRARTDVHLLGQSWCQQSRVIEYHIAEIELNLVVCVTVSALRERKAEICSSAVQGRL
jgi:hypothetical protein